MRDRTRMNLSVLPHAIRRVMNDRLKGTPGLPRGGSLWRRLTGLITQERSTDGVVIETLLRLAKACDLETVIGDKVSISADQNDFDIGHGATIRVDPGTTADRTITGFAGGTRGRRIRIYNVSSVKKLILAINSGSSAVGNRILSPAPDFASVVLNEYDGVELEYDPDAQGVGFWVAHKMLPAHNVLSANHLDAVTATLIRGDVLYVNSTPKLDRLAKAAAGWVLGYSANDLVQLDRRVVVIRGDVTTTSSSLVDVTALSFSVLANADYRFEFYIPAQTSSISGGSGYAFSINGPASPTRITFDIEGFTTNTAASKRKAAAYDTELSFSPDTADADFPVVIRGVLRNGSNAGTLIVRFRRTGLANTARAMSGAAGWIQEL